MKNIFSLLFLTTIWSASIGQNVGTFYGSEDGTLSTDLKIGRRNSTSTTPHFYLKSQDGGAAELILHSVRWGGGYTWSRESSGGVDRNIAYLYGSNSESYFQLFNHNQDVKAQIRSGGISYFNGGNVGIGTSTPSATLEVIGTMRASTDANRFITIHSSSDGNSYINYNGGSSSSRLGFQIDGSSKMSIMDNGNVGIGTTSTGTHKLKVAGNIGSDKVYWGTSGAHLTTSQGAAIELRGTGIPFIDFSNDVSTDFDVRMVLKNDDFLQISGGSVGIGTSSSGSHKLAVEGSIGAREIKVEANGWSDFVFEKDYELPTLEEVEQHINEKGHLPEIPSEAEVTDNGINLGKMDAKLLRKIEELTLYMIDMNKRMNELETENQELKVKVESIEKE